MKINIPCPFGRYNEKMQIICDKVNNPCGNQYFKKCKGWWVLNESANKCPLRKDGKDADI